MLKNVLIKKGLSSRESEVADLVTQGLSNKAVASQLYVTEKTIKFHLTNIYRKLNMKSRAQLIVWCMPYIDKKPVNEEENKNYIPAGNSVLKDMQS